MEQRPLTRAEVAAIARGAVQEALARLGDETRDLRRCVTDVERVLISEGKLDARAEREEPPGR